MSLVPLLKNDAGLWDPLHLEVTLPAMVSGLADPGELLWNLEIPKNAVNEEVWLSVDCGNPTNYWTSATFGLLSSDLEDIPISRYHPEIANEYVNGVSMSISNYDIKIWSDDEYISTESNKYWLIFPSKSKSITTSVAALTCVGTFYSKNEKGYTRTLLILNEAGNGPYYD